MAVGLGLLLLPRAATAQEVKAGERFPSFEARDLLTEKPIVLERFAGRVVLIDFWATWCGPCRGELPNVRKVYEKYHPEGLEIISISLDKSVADCKAYVEKEKMNWYHIADGKGWDASLAKKHKIRGIPAMFVVGRDGRVVASGGAVRGEKLAKVVAKALAEKYVVPPERAAKAAAALAKAEALDAEGKLVEAVQAYEAAAADFPDTEVGQKAAERAKALRADPKMAEALAAAEKAREAEKWLHTARQMARNNSFTLARKYYNKVIEEYPGTEQARTAGEELEALGKS